METEALTEILNRVKGSDANAFNELFKMCFDPLVNFAIHFVKITADAEDIVSSVFVSLWHNREKLPAFESPKSYLYRSVKNASLNYLKHKTLTTKNITVHHSQGYPVKLHMESKELNHLIQQAVNKLSEQRRIIFMLIKEEGMKSKDVAAILNLSIRTVENQLYRAVNAIAIELRTYLGYNPKNRAINNFLLMLY